MTSLCFLLTLFYAAQDYWSSKNPAVEFVNTYVQDLVTLSFDTLGGSAIDSKRMAKGTYIDTTAFTTTRTGYILEDWYTDKHQTQEVSLQS